MGEILKFSPPRTENKPFIEAANYAIDGYMTGRQNKQKAARLPTKHKVQIEELKNLGREQTREYRRAAKAAFKALEYFDPEEAQLLLRNKGLRRGVFVPFKEIHK